MGRRLSQLSLSPVRTTPRPHAYSDPPPFVTSHSDPTSLQVPQTDGFGFSDRSFQNTNVHHFAPVPPPAPIQHQTHTDQRDDGTLDGFLRRSTIMTSSTDRTTGTLHRVLQGYSDPYIKAVRRLVKRYTAPNCQGSGVASPISEMMPNTSWLFDDDAPPILGNRPYHLPGDYLNLDQLLQFQPACFDEDEQHRTRACLCSAEPAAESSPWVTGDDLTARGYDILRNGIQNVNLGECDTFGNTVLHFIAVRASFDILLAAIASSRCDPILNARNTAGQTFLHLLPSASLQDYERLSRLLRMLFEKKFDVYARDVYGRSFFHMILLSEQGFPNGLLECYEEAKYMKRDAFNVTPAQAPQPMMGINRAYTQAMDLDPPAPAPPPAQHRFPSFSDKPHEAAHRYECELLAFVNSTQQFPNREDAEGRNGLHCLAMATLSSSSVLKKYGLADADAGLDRRGKKNQEPKDLDSCTERLSLRLSILSNLINAGVDTNHYDSSGNTPLMAFAALLPEEDDYKLGPKILEELIANGADIHARNRHGETALHIAVRCGRKLAARTLVRKGANVHVRDAAGRSLLDVADVKTRNTQCSAPKEYVHFEACRAYLSGTKGFAVQNPTLLQEWGVPQLSGLMR